jgi:hypothetical protein
MDEQLKQCAGTICGRLEAGIQRRLSFGSKLASQQGIQLFLVSHFHGLFDVEQNSIWKIHGFTGPLFMKSLFTSYDIFSTSCGDDVIEE